MHLPIRALAVGAALALTLAACGDDDEDDATTTESTEAPADASGGDDAETTTTAPAGDEAGGETAAGGAVELAETSLGSILTSDGMTLYVFTPDDGGAPTCYDDCAGTWPPLLAEGDVTVGDGVDAALFDTVARDDGGEQVTVDGWPLYFYAADAAPGDVNGQGVGDRWFVVGADGAVIEEAAAAPMGY